MRINHSTIMFGAEILWRSMFKSRAPLVVGWAVTNKCNLRCAYCEWPEKPSEELSTEKACDLIGQMARAGTKYVVLSGGEPLLREDLGLLLDAMKKKDMAVSINTNGILVPEHIGLLSDVRKVQLSLDGPENIHDRLRGKGAFESVTEAAQACKSMGITISFNVTLTRHNLDQVEWILKFASSYNAAADFQPVHNVHADEKIVSALVPSGEKYEQTIDLLAQLKTSGAPVINSFSCLRHLRRFPHHADIFCSAGLVITRIDPAGRLFPCNMLREKNKWPDAMQVGFKKAFSQLPKVDCRQCWCSATVEMNLCCAGKLEAIRNQARIF